MRDSWELTKLDLLLTNCLDLIHYACIHMPIYAAIPSTWESPQTHPPSARPLTDLISESSSHSSTVAMEKKPWLKDEAILQHPFLFIIALSLVFIITDPFCMGPVGGHVFKPVKHTIAPYKEVMESWPGDNMSRLSDGKLEFTDQVFGPESLEFDKLGRGPYTGMADGRIVRWMGEDLGWETFATVSPNWTEQACAQGVDSTTYKQWKFEKQCGRPLGLRFNHDTGDLYIADAYYGLLVVGPNGGLATPLVTHVNGESLLFANDLDIHKNGSIFFTDTSKRYNRV